MCTCYTQYSYMLGRSIFCVHTHWHTDQTPYVTFIVSVTTHWSSSKLWYIVCWYECRIEYCLVLMSLHLLFTLHQRFLIHTLSIEHLNLALSMLYPKRTISRVFTLSNQCLSNEVGLQLSKFVWLKLHFVPDWAMHTFMAYVCLHIFSEQTMHTLLSIATPRFRLQRNTVWDASTV